MSNQSASGQMVRICIALTLVSLAAGVASAELISQPTGPYLISGPKAPTESTLIAPHQRSELSSDAHDLVAGNNGFALDLYRRISAGQEAGNNVLVSPLSISAALSMTYAGARGRTAEQMAGVLRFTLPDDRLHAAFGEVIRDLDATREGYQLSIANRLFGQHGFAFEASFLDVTRRDYEAPLEPLDFASNPDGSRTHINDWVEENTNDKIQDLLPQGSVTVDTRLVLANAIYFNGRWKHKFDEEATQDAAFYTADGTTANVPTMFQQQQFKYSKFDGFQMLEMPYAGDDLSMVVMLPDARDGLAELEVSLTTELLDESLAAMVDREALVYLPKFKFDASFGLSGTLQSMGMTDAFGNADFSGIADETLAIQDVLHKAFIDVNEAGAEAAAATAVVIGTTSVCYGCFSSPPLFRADHPFLFALRDTHSGSLMFLGRVAEPGESSLTSLGGPSVPEPASIVLVLVGLAVVCRARW